MNELASRIGNRPWAWPQLGSVVDKATSFGSEAAVQILHGAADEVLNIVKDVVYALKIDEIESHFNLGLWGSNIIKSSVMQQYFIVKAESLYPGVRIMLPERESVDGVVTMALEEVADRRS